MTIQAASVRFCCLPDGRRLVYTEYGDPNGHPTLYFHGFPGSRLEAQIANARASEYAIRLIAIDRPGFGGSDFQPGRRLLDWSADVSFLADYLELGTFSIIGVSGGGPYAAACAFALPKRLNSVSIVSGMGPLDNPGLGESMLLMDRWVLRLARDAPKSAKAGLQLTRMIKLAPRFFVDMMSRQLSPIDREVLARPEIFTIICRSFSESLRQGPCGHALELALLAKPWGFEAADISMCINLWYGAQDRVVPQTHGHYLHRVLERPHSHFFDHAGHFSLVVDHTAEIFATIAQARSRSWKPLRREMAERTSYQTQYIL